MQAAIGGGKRAVADMSLAELRASTLLRCPVCNGEMDEFETLCVACRAEIERDVLSVAGDAYQPPSASQSSRRVPVARAIAVKAEAIDAAEPQTSAEVAVMESDGDDDLLPLVPFDEPKQNRPTTLPAGGGAGTYRQAPQNESPSVMGLQSPATRWKFALIAIAALVLAALAAVGLWSFVTPS